MSILTWYRGPKAVAVRPPQRTRLGVEALDERALPSVGLGYVGLAKAPASEVSYLAGQVRSRTGEVEVSFLPFEFNPANPFGNADAANLTGATKLAHDTLTAKFKGKLRLTVDLEWFVHSAGKNGKLDGGTGESAAVYGRPASQAFWAAWGAAAPTADQQQLRARFLDRVHRTDAWVAELRTWAAGQKVQDKLGVTLVPVLEDECPSKAAYTNLVNAIKAQQTADGVAATPLRRSRNGDHSGDFRVSGVSLELHGTWADVKGLLRRGDTWSNDGTPYGINAFVKDGTSAKAAGVSVLYWNGDMNGTPKTDTNWASRAVTVFSGSTAAANKARLTLVFDIF